MGSHIWDLGFLEISEIYYGPLVLDPIFQQIISFVLCVETKFAAKKAMHEIFCLFIQDIKMFDFPQNFACSRRMPTSTRYIFV
jgi:hypothetical protein